MIGFNNYKIIEIQLIISIAIPDIFTFSFINTFILAKKSSL